jgi:hypothetical protein
MADLRNRGIVTKVRTLKTGQTAGGIPFTRGPLGYLFPCIACQNRCLKFNPANYANCV